ncbi:radical SAM protein [Curtanaerobium respiraculi]|uniref:radical SAM protein n=1 Tax=Curtanaerobium respiraculi TaxID=2949669 RepID=UPI0024B3AEA9|nr:radical SAM protein [Curtanaerobium respiraculi]
MRPLDEIDVRALPSEAYRPYASLFVDQRSALAERIASFGLPTVPRSRDAAQIARIRRGLEESGCSLGNGGKSLAWNRMSPACERCRTGEKSVSFFLSLACDRKCWFCFNENQCDWDAYRNAKTDWRSDMDSRFQQMGGLDFVALTGGEPMLYPEEACAFFAHAKQLDPAVHCRLYTAGLNVDAKRLEELAASGLDEIRFSCKLDDPPARKRELVERIESACGVVPTVMVEMPVIPGSHDEMLQLLDHLEDAGAFGINLLEFCFPLHHADEYRRRGMQLVEDPYRVVYDYGYAGAIPVAGSELLSLQLMAEKVAQGTRLSLHYCSLENKNTAQIFEQNHGGALSIPGYRFSKADFFYRTVRVFGEDAATAARALEGEGAFVSYDAEGRMASFSPDHLAMVASALPKAARFHASSAVIERGEDGRERFREVDLHVLEPADVERPEEV